MLFVKTVSEYVKRYLEKLKVSFIDTCQTILETKKRDHKGCFSQIQIEERRQKPEMVNASRTRREKQEAMEEYSRAHKEVKKIPPEALKANVEMAVDELEGFFYKIWMEEKYPHD